MDGFDLRHLFAILICKKKIITDHVYFTLMSKDEVENCLQSGLVKKSLNLVNKLNEAMDYFDKPTDQKIDYW